MLSLQEAFENETEKQPRFTIPYYCFASTTSSFSHLTATYLLRFEMKISLSKIIEKLIYFTFTIDNDNDFHYHLMYMSS